MRRISLWLLAVFCLALLAACGNTGGGNTGGSNAGTGDTTAASATADAAAIITEGPPTAEATAATAEETEVATTEATAEATSAATADATSAATTDTTAGATTMATTDATTGATAGATTDATAGATTDATAGPTSAAAAGPLPNLNGRKVVIGTDAAYPPFESVDPQSNQIVGFDVDLMNEIAKLINIQPEFRNAPFDTIFTALNNDEFDAVMSAATITEERKQVVNFSDPYFQIGQLIVVRTDNNEINGPQDLANGPLVGVQTGTTGETAARDTARVPQDKLRGFQTIDLAFAELANNGIDAVVADQPTVENYSSQPQYAGKIKTVGGAFTTEDYGIALPKDDQELLDAINAALAQIKSGNTIQQLKDKYQIK